VCIRPVAVQEQINNQAASLDCRAMFTRQPDHARPSKKTKPSTLRRPKKKGPSKFQRIIADPFDHSHSHKNRLNTGDAGSQAPPEENPEFLVIGQELELPPSPVKHAHAALGLDEYDPSEVDDDAEDFIPTSAQGDDTIGIEQVDVSVGGLSGTAAVQTMNEQDPISPSLIDHFANDRDGQQGSGSESEATEEGSDKENSAPVRGVQATEGPLTHREPLQELPAMRKCESPRARKKQRIVNRLEGVIQESVQTNDKIDALIASLSGRLIDKELTVRFQTPKVDAALHRTGMFKEVELSQRIATFRQQVRIENTSLDQMEASMVLASPANEASAMEDTERVRVSVSAPVESEDFDANGLADTEVFDVHRVREFMKSLSDLDGMLEQASAEQDAATAASAASLELKQSHDDNAAAAATAAEDAVNESLVEESHDDVPANVSTRDVNLSFSYIGDDAAGEEEEDDQEEHPHGMSSMSLGEEDLVHNTATLKTAMPRPAAEGQESTRKNQKHSKFVPAIPGDQTMPPSQQVTPRVTALVPRLNLIPVLSVSHPGTARVQTDRTDHTDTDTARTHVGTPRTEAEVEVHPDVPALNLSKMDTTVFFINPLAVSLPRTATADPADGSDARLGARVDAVRSGNVFEVLAQADKDLAHGGDPVPLLASSQPCSGRGSGDDENDTSGLNHTNTLYDNTSSSASPSSRASTPTAVSAGNPSFIPLLVASMPPSPDTARRQQEWTESQAAAYVPLLIESLPPSPRDDEQTDVSSSSPPPSSSSSSSSPSAAFIPTIQHSMPPSPKSARVEAVDVAPEEVQSVQSAPSDTDEVVYVPVLDVSQPNTAPPSPKGAVAAPVPASNAAGGDDSWMDEVGAPEEHSAGTRDIVFDPNMMIDPDEDEEGEDEVDVTEEVSSAQESDTQTATVEEEEKASDTAPAADDNSWMNDLGDHEGPGTRDIEFDFSALDDICDEQDEEADEESDGEAAPEAEAEAEAITADIVQEAEQDTEALKAADTIPSASDTIVANASVAVKEEKEEKAIAKGGRGSAAGHSSTSSSSSDASVTDITNIHTSTSITVLPEAKKPESDSNGAWMEEIGGHGGPGTRDIVFDASAMEAAGAAGGSESDEEPQSGSENAAVGVLQQDKQPVREQPAQQSDRQPQQEKQHNDHLSSSHTASSSYSHSSSTSVTSSSLHVSTAIGGGVQRAGHKDSSANQSRATHPDGSRGDSTEQRRTLANNAPGSFHTSEADAAVEATARAVAASKERRNEVRRLMQFFAQ
jgi:hypothetical protein